MQFSERTAQHDEPNRLARAVAAALAAGTGLLDLTIGNPTRAELPYDEAAILASLADARGLVYEPASLGTEDAREAVARDWQARSATIDAGHIALTASTSEAYAVLFKMLCDPGDEILVPAPSYPLLGFLAAFESVTLRSYPLVYAGGWHVDLESLRALVTPRTRAIVVVNPNNPTGSYLGRGELDALLDIELPIISDEVFATYPLAIPEGRVTTVVNETRGLVFGLAGLSKLAALPQLKLGWIGVAGAPELVARALPRLELVLDAYLSVGSPVQVALPRILAARGITEDAIRRRTRANLARARSVLGRASSASVLDVEGGWYAILRVPETMTDEQWAVALVTEQRVHVQPGYFFDMNRGAHLVVSLLTPESVFAEGLTRIAAFVAERG